MGSYGTNSHIYTVDYGIIRNKGKKGLTTLENAQTENVPEVPTPEIPTHNAYPLMDSPCYEL